MVDAGDKDGSWVDGLRFDPDANPDARVLTGYARRSPDGSKLRLYLSLQLNEYIEVATSDILDHRTFGNSKRGLVQTVVWVKGGTVVRKVATVKLSPPTSLESEAAFLRGSITERYAASAETDTRSLDILSMKPTLMTEVSICVKC